jgi:propionate CoA-transferase
MTGHSTAHERMAALRGSGKGKVVSADDAVRLLRDGDMLATGGFVGIGFPENLAVALEKRFVDTGAPRDLVSSTPRGRATADRRLNLGHDGPCGA